MENKDTLQRCLDNPYYINQQYEEIITIKPKVEWVFKKDLRNDDLWSKLWIDKLIYSLWKEIGKAAKLWIKIIWKVFNIDTWLTEETYLTKWTNEQTQDYYWSLNNETKRQLLYTIKQAIDNGWSVDKLQEEIIKIDDVIFWKGRAKTIAITEIHRAYERWKFTPMEELSNQGKIVQKFRLTCNDDKVRETHMEAQDEGWVDIDYIFPSVWVKMPPWWYNCRCNLLYNVL